MLRWPERSDAANRSKKGHAHHRHTGVASASSTSVRVRIEIDRLPTNIPLIAMMRSGAENAAAIHRRRVMSLSS